MRWLKNQVGDTKIVRKFLWFPTTIDNETRWLEFATIKYLYYSTIETYHYYDGSVSEPIYYWRRIRFIDV